MICIVQMDKGTPNTDPKPIGWIISLDIDEAIRNAEQIGDIELAEWIEKHRLAARGSFDLPARFGEGRRFALLS